MTHPTQQTKPIAFLPVFTGTNCDYDTTKAFVRAGAEVTTSVFRNLTEADIFESIDEPKNLRMSDTCSVGRFFVGRRTRWERQIHCQCPEQQQNIRTNTRPARQRRFNNRYLQWFPGTYKIGTAPLRASRNGYRRVANAIQKRHKQTYIADSQHESEFCEFALACRFRDRRDTFGGNVARRGQIGHFERVGRKTFRKTPDSIPIRRFRRQYYYGRAFQSQRLDVCNRGNDFRKRTDTR